MIRRLYRSSSRLRRLLRRAKNAVVAGAAAAALWIMGRLALERAMALAEFVGTLLFRVLRTPRRLAIEHLRVAFGDELSPAACEHLARASFVNIARCFCELAQIDEIRARADRYFEIEGEEHIRQALASGTGAVVITGHIGNWELLAAYFAWRGFPVAAIARRIYADRLNQMIVDFRARQGVETILRESPSASRQILRALKKNALLAILIDQDTKAPAISVPFFGRLARTPAAAAALAVRRQLPAVAIFIQRRSDGGQRVVVSPAFQVDCTGDRHADIRALTKQFTATLETQIRKNPAEWVWWHRRWRRTPIPQLDLDKDFEYTLPNAAPRGRS